MYLNIPLYGATTHEKSRIQRSPHITMQATQNTADSFIRQTSSTSLKFGDLVTENPPMLTYKNKKGGGKKLVPLYNTEPSNIKVYQRIRYLVRNYGTVRKVTEQFQHPTSARNIFSSGPPKVIINHPSTVEYALAGDKALLERFVETATTGGIFQYLIETFGKTINKQNPFRVTDIGNGGNAIFLFYLLGIKNALDLSREKKLTPKEFHLIASEFTPAGIAIMVHLYKQKNNLRSEEAEDLVPVEKAYDHYIRILYKQGSKSTSLIDSGMTIGNDGMLWLKTQKQLEPYIKIVPASIYELPKNEYHFATTFFVPCSMGGKKEFRLSMKAFCDSIVDGGVAEGALMKETKFWYDGTTLVKSANVKQTDVEKALSENGIDAIVEVVDADPIRPGAEGMIIFFGVKGPPGTLDRLGLREKILNSQTPKETTNA